jgi:hypothetical protein
MANTSAYRVIGPTYAIAVSTTSSTAITVTPVGNDQVNYVGLLNTNNFPVAVTITPSSAPAAVLPAGGSTSNSVVLGVGMSTPYVIACPVNSYSVTAICGGSNSGTIYVTPMADQN